MPQSWSGIRN